MTCDMMSADGHLGVTVRMQAAAAALTGGQEIRKKVPSSLICVIRFHSTLESDFSNVISYIHIEEVDMWIVDNMIFSCKKPYG